MDRLEFENEHRLTVKRIDRENAGADQHLVDQYQIRTQPAYILLDSNGELVKIWYGSVTQTTFEAVIDTIIQ